MLSYIQQHSFWSHLKPDTNNVSLGYLKEKSCCDKQREVKGWRPSTVFLNYANLYLVTMPHLVQEISYLLELRRWFSVNKTERTTDIHVTIHARKWDHDNNPWQVMLLSTIHIHATSGTILIVVLSWGSSSVYLAYHCNYFCRKSL